MNAFSRSTATLRSRTSLAIGLRLGVVAVALFVVACQTPAASAPPSGAPSVPPIAIASSDPSAVPSGPVGSPVATPSTPVPTPTPAPTPVPTWSKPVTVAGLEGCSSVVAAVDESGTDHLAAACGEQGGRISYATSRNGMTWKVTKFAPPAGRLEMDPQLAFTSDTLYLAYTRVAPTDGGCGDDGLADVGVYYRTRPVSGGSWSAPVRVGAVADHLQALRVSGGTIHATVQNEKDGKTAYETVSGGSTKRYVIGDAAGWTSLRVGDDGQGRVAYENGSGIAYGTVEGGSFTSETIPGSTRGWQPTLTLAPGSVAWIAWTRSDHGAGCVGGGEDPEDGTYLSTNASGSWVTEKVASMIGGTSLTIDPATGDLHLVVSDVEKLVHFQRPAAGGSWKEKTLADHHPSSAVIRQNPTDGSLFVAYVADPTEDGSFVVRVLSRR